MVTSTNLDLTISILENCLYFQTVQTVSGVIPRLWHFISSVLFVSFSMYVFLNIIRVLFDICRLSVVHTCHPTGVSDSNYVAMDTTVSPMLKLQ